MVYIMMRLSSLSSKGTSMRVSSSKLGFCGSQEHTTYVLGKLQDHS